MTRAVRFVLGTVGTIAALGALRLGSFVPYTVEGNVGGILRLAWRARGERVRDCRRRTPEELAKLPTHMRQEEVCEGRVVPYRLVVVLDGVESVNRLVHGAGARQDRPLYVSQDLSVRPGMHRIAVTFTLEGMPRPAGADTAAPAEPLATPPRLALDTSLILGSRRVLLVTYDEEREHLVLLDGSSR